MFPPHFLPPPRKFSNICSKISCPPVLRIMNLVSGPDDWSSCRTQHNWILKTTLNRASRAGPVRAFRGQCTVKNLCHFSGFPATFLSEIKTRNLLLYQQIPHLCGAEKAVPGEPCERCFPDSLAKTRWCGMRRRDLNCFAALPSPTKKYHLAFTFLGDVKKTASLFPPPEALRRFSPPPVPGARVQSLPHKNRSRVAPFLCGEGGIERALRAMLLGFALRRQDDAACAACLP